MLNETLIAQLAEWRRSLPVFRKNQLIAWQLEGLHAGWVQPELAERLMQSGLFNLQPGGLALRPDIGGPLAKSQALQQLAETLRAEGRIPAWRDERHDWLDEWGRVRLSIERAAFRTLGLRSRAVHIHAYVDEDTIWLARRAASKAVDPGRLDNLAAGLVAAGESLEDCMLRELAEEAGVPARLGRLAQACGVIHSQRLEADGVHDELLYCYDLALPPDFQPCNQDGEVAEFLRLRSTELPGRLRDMTWDAGQVSCAWLLRTWQADAGQPG